MSLWIVIFPFDVVKSRMQVQNTRQSFVSLLVQIGRDEGLSLCLLVAMAPSQT